MLCKDLQNKLSGKSQVRIIQSDTFKNTYKPPPQNGTERKSSASGCSQFRCKIPALKKSIYKYRNTRRYVCQLENKQAWELSFRLVWQMEVDSQDGTFWIDEHEHTHTQRHRDRQRGKEREALKEWWNGGGYVCVWCDVGRVCRARNMKCKGPKAETLLTLETKRAAETTIAFISSSLVLSLSDHCCGQDIPFLYNTGNKYTKLF